MQKTKKYKMPMLRVMLMSSSSMLNIRKVLFVFELSLLGKSYLLACFSSLCIWFGERGFWAVCVGRWWSRYIWGWQTYCLAVEDCEKQWNWRIGCWRTVVIVENLFMPFGIPFSSVFTEEIFSSLLLYKVIVLPKIGYTFHTQRQ